MSLNPALRRYCAAHAILILFLFAGGAVDPRDRPGTLLITLINTRRLAKTRYPSHDLANIVNCNFGKNMHYYEIKLDVYLTSIYV